MRTMRYINDWAALTLYVLFFHREHQHLFTFYVIPPH